MKQRPVCVNKKMYYPKNHSNLVSVTGVLYAILNSYDLCLEHILNFITELRTPQFSHVDIWNLLKIEPLIIPLSRKTCNAHREVPKLNKWKHFHNIFTCSAVWKGSRLSIDRFTCPNFPAFTSFSCTFLWNIQFVCDLHTHTTIRLTTYMHLKYNDNSLSFDSVPFIAELEHLFCNCILSWHSVLSHYCQAGTAQLQWNKALDTKNSG